MCFNICGKIRSWWNSRKKKNSKNKQEPVENEGSDMHKDELHDVQEPLTSENAKETEEGLQGGTKSLENPRDEELWEIPSFYVLRRCLSDPEMLRRVLTGNEPKVVFIPRHHIIGHCRIGDYPKKDEIERKRLRVSITPKNWVRFEESEKPSSAPIVPTLPPPPSRTLLERKRNRHIRVPENTAGEGVGVETKEFIEIEEKTGPRSDMNDASRVPSTYESSVAAADNHFSATDSSSDPPERKSNFGEGSIHSGLEFKSEETDTVLNDFETATDRDTTTMGPGIKAEEVVAGTWSSIKDTRSEASSDSISTAPSDKNSLVILDEHSAVDASFAPVVASNLTGIPSVHAKETDADVSKNSTGENSDFIGDSTSESILDDSNVIETIGVSGYDSEDLRVIENFLNGLVDKVVNDPDSSVK